jgi:DNA-binding MarR family transcriptional regulator
MTTREDELNLALEAMYYGFRNMVKNPDQHLEHLGYSRVHHRILYFVGRNPQCSLNELLNTMKVSKQYLNRPIKQLMQDGYLLQSIDPFDRRIRRLQLSEQGTELEQAISGEQRRRFGQIFQQVGPEAEKNWHQVMQLLAEEEAPCNS